jgi:hypothetical protein
MTAHRTFSKVAAASLMAGLGGLLSCQIARADDTLLPVLAGSDTAIILGGTTEPTPSTAFAQTAEYLYLHALGFDGGATGSAVCDMVMTTPCNDPLQVLTTPELIQQGPSSLAAAKDVVGAIQAEFADHPANTFTSADPLTVFGYSQSATAESIAMTQLQADGIDPADVHFVFIGDPSLSGTGVWPNIVSDLDGIFGNKLTDAVLTGLGFDGVLGNVTPDDISPTTIFSRAGDGVPYFQDDFEQGGLFSPLVHLFTTHVEYLGLTPEEVANATVSSDQMITNVAITDTGVHNVDAWLTAVLEHGAAGSGLLESLFQSVELYLGFPVLG